MSIGGGLILTGSPGKNYHQSTLIENKNKVMLSSKVFIRTGLVGYLAHYSLDIWLDSMEVCHDVCLFVHSLSYMLQVYMVVANFSSNGFSIQAVEQVSKHLSELR